MLGPRQDYLIHREKNGFLTALNQEGKLTTWSVASGKLLYTQKVEKNDYDKYVIYQSDDSDYS